MALKHFRPKSGRFLTMIAFFRSALATTIANSTTTSYNIGGIHRRAFLERLNFSSRIAVASAGAVTAIVSKYNAATDTATALTAAFDLKVIPVEESSVVPFLSTLSDLDRTLNEGDTLRVVITAAGTITTQPSELVLTAEVAVLE